MTAAEWLAVAATIGTACGGAITLAARMILTAAREMVDGQKVQTLAQKETTAAVSDLRLELMALRTRVDTLLDVTPIRGHDREDPTPVRGPYSMRTRKE